MRRSVPIVVLTAVLLVVLPTTTMALQAISLPKVLIATTAYGSRRSSESTNPRLQYRNGDVEDHVQRLSFQEEATISSSTNSRWWKGLFPGHSQYSATSLDAASEEISQRVDEYLKFLDKRYHQIHESEPVVSVPAQPTKLDRRSVAEPLPAMTPPKPIVKQESSSLESTSSSSKRSVWAVVLGWMLWKQQPLPSRATLKALVQQQKTKLLQAAVIQQVFAQGSMKTLAWKRIPELPLFLLRWSGGWHMAVLLLGVLSTLASRVRMVLLSSGGVSA